MFIYEVSITLKVVLSTLFLLRDLQDVDREARVVPTQNMAGATVEVEKVQPEQEEEEPLVARQQAKN